MARVWTQVDERFLNAPVTAMHTLPPYKDECIQEWPINEKIPVSGCRSSGSSAVAVGENPVGGWVDCRTMGCMTHRRDSEGGSSY